MTLRNQALSGIRWTTFSSLGRAVLQILQVAILARILAPSEFGVIAVVLAIMAFLQIFADAGVSNAIIHFQHVTTEQLSSLFWLNVTISALLSLALVIASPWIAQWYQQPVLPGLLCLAALGLFANSLGQQLRFNAQKHLRFSRLAQVDLCAAFCGFAGAVGMAWLGAGVYALAGAGLINAVVGSLMAWGLLAQGWRPLLRLRLQEIKPFLSFGAYMVGNNLANTFNVQIDVLLGGRLLGAHATGLYSVSKNLTMNVQAIINPIVTQVGLPVMAKAQEDKGLLRRIYLQTMRMTASVNFPIYIAIVVFSADIVSILFGPQWIDSVPLLRIMAIWGLVRSIANPSGSLLFATGRANLAFKWNAALLLITAPVVWFGSSYGVLGMAVAMCGLMTLLYMPNWYFLIRPCCDLRFGEYFLQSAIPLLISIVAGVFGYSVALFFEGHWMRLVMGGVAGLVVYLGISFYCNRVWTKAMVELLFSGFAKRGAGQG